MKYSIRVFCVISIVSIIEFALGYIAGGYDYTNNRFYKTEYKVQIKCHSLAMEMLDMYYKNDTTCFFEDVIMETDAYYEYNTLVEGDWENFGYSKE